MGRSVSTVTITCDCCGHTFTEGTEAYDTIVLDTTGSNTMTFLCLSKGCSTHQRAALVDRVGEESVAHQADDIIAIAAPTNPAAAAVSGGGVFVADDYFWKVTALTLAGETTPSSEVTATIASGGSATITWTAVTGATGYKIYRTDTTGVYTTPRLVGAVVGQATATFTDVGGPLLVGSPPASNQSAGIPVRTLPYS